MEIERGQKIDRDFFKREPVICARELIGCTLGLGECCGMIVETEAYAAKDDPACHTWRRPSAREFIARHQSGTAYVYLNYGMHWLFNLLVKGGEHDGFVLIRALEPLQGNEVMQQRRRRPKITELCNGPGKLTQSLAITGDHHAMDPISGKEWLLLNGNVTSDEILVSPRIGISHARQYPWRFFLKGSAFVSAHGAKNPLKTEKIKSRTLEFNRLSPAF